MVGRGRYSDRGGDYYGSDPYCDRDLDGGRDSYGTTMLQTAARRYRRLRRRRRIMAAEHRPSIATGPCTTTASMTAMRPP